MALRLLVTGQMFVVRVFPGLPWERLLRIEYFTDYASLPAVYLFLRSLFPSEAPRWAVRSALVVAAAGVLTLLFPGRVSSLFIPPYEAVLVGFVVYALAVLGRAVARRREGAALYIAGLALFFAALGHDLLVYNFVLHSVELLPVGLFVLTLAQSLVLAQRFAAAHRELQHSRRIVTEREEQVHLVATARQEIEEVRETDVRRASHLLHPAVIDVGLVPAIRWLAARFGSSFRVDVEVGAGLAELDSPIQPGIPEAVRLAAYRVVEEALGNVQAHAGAARGRPRPDPRARAVHRGPGRRPGAGPRSPSAGARTADGGGAGGRDGWPVGDRRRPGTRHGPPGLAAARGPAGAGICSPHPGSWASRRYVRTACTRG